MQEAFQCLRFQEREFGKTAATYTAAASFLSAGAFKLHAAPLGLPIGCQTWPVREMIAKDFPGTMKQLSDAGFQSIELCSPAGSRRLRASAASAKYKGPELRQDH